jgi:hypothetical protein
MFRKEETRKRKRPEMNLKRVLLKKIAGAKYHQTLGTTLYLIQLFCIKKKRKNNTE